MLTIDVDPRQLITAMNGMESQLPFAVAKALNECAVKFQADERVVLHQGFMIRRPWVDQGIKIDRQDFATKTKPEVRIHVAQDRDFLNKFEVGGTRLPTGGRKGLTVPLGARASPASIVKASLRPKALHFKKVSTKGAYAVYKGDNRTFMIQKPDGSGVILQRKSRKVALKKRHHGPLMVGQRRDYSLVTLFVLRPRTPLPADLHFHATARKSFQASWPIAFNRWWAEAVRTARPAG